MGIFRLIELRKGFISFLYEYINDPLDAIMEKVGHKPVRFVVQNSSHLHLFERMEERKCDDSGLGQIGTLLRELIRTRLCVLLYTLNKPDRKGAMVVSRGQTHLKMGIYDNDDAIIIVIRTYVNTKSRQNADYNEVIIVD